MRKFFEDQFYNFGNNVIDGLTICAGVLFIGAVLKVVFGG